MSARLREAMSEGFEAVEELSSDWAQSSRGQKITVSRRALLTRETRIFAIGSCFAVEIRRALRAAGYCTFPDYTSLAFDPQTQAPARLPERDNINHYDTFVLRQEIERAIGHGMWREADFWELKHHRFGKTKRWARVFQDPYRRDIYASSLDSLFELSSNIGQTIDAGLMNADVIIITLGLTECWRSRTNGLYVALAPRSRDDEVYERLEFNPSSYAQNLQNLRAIVHAILSTYPKKQIVLTVSPVALSRTWTNEDIVVANQYSKSTLRAAVGELCREMPHVLYWPSFEYAMNHDVFGDDGRHVRPECVAEIVGAFLRSQSISANQPQSEQQL
jgi:hypothetical protein